MANTVGGLGSPTNLRWVDNGDGTVSISAQDAMVLAEQISTNTKLDEVKALLVDIKRF